MTTTLQTGTAPTATSPDQEVQRPFSQVLRAETRQAHEEAEGSPFIQNLLSGRLPLAAHVALTAEYYVIYTALEAAVRRVQSDPVAAPFCDPGLLRLPSLEADLTHLAGPDFARRLPGCSAAHAYAERIEAASAWSGTFVAHHYVRYLGDLSGGQAIGRILSRTFDLAPGTDGLRFYHFPAINKPKPFKDAYRRALDAAAWDADQRRRVVAEADEAFRCNTAVFADLDARFPLAA